MTVGNTSSPLKEILRLAALLSCPPAMLKGLFWETEEKEGGVSDKWRKGDRKGTGGDRAAGGRAEGEDEGRKGEEQVAGRG